MILKYFRAFEEIRVVFIELSTYVYFNPLTKWSKSSIQEKCLLICMATKGMGSDGINIV